jgi:hypothetical protein
MNHTGTLLRSSSGRTDRKTLLERNCEFAAEDTEPDATESVQKTPNDPIHRNDIDRTRGAVTSPSSRATTRQ